MGWGDEIIETNIYPKKYFCLTVGEKIFSPTQRQKRKVVSAVLSIT